MFFVLPSSFNTTGATIGAGNTYPIFSGIRGAQSLVFCALLCRSLFVYLLVLFVLFLLFVVLSVLFLIYGCNTQLNMINHSPIRFYKFSHFTMILIVNTELLNALYNLYHQWSKNCAFLELPSLDSKRK